MRLSPPFSLHLMLRFWAVCLFLLAHQLAFAQVDERIPQFCKAVQQGELEVVAQLMAAGVNPDCDCELPTHAPLAIAVLQNDAGMLRMLASHGASLCNEENGIPILRLCPEGSAIQQQYKRYLRQGEYLTQTVTDELLSTLPRQPEDSLLVDCRCKSPRALVLAVMRQDNALVARLLDLGAKTFVPADLGVSSFLPLHRAATTGNLAAVEMLLAHGAEAGRVDWEGYIPLEYACLNGDPLVVRAVLARTDSAALRQSHRPWGIFGAAVLMADSSLIDQLLKKKASIPQEQAAQLFILWRAATTGNLAFFKYCHRQLTQNMDLGSMVSRYQSFNPLGGAAITDRLPLLAYLYDSLHCPLEMPSVNGRPLAAATQFGRIDAMRYLLARGANPNAENGAQDSPLEVAISHCQVPALQLLIQSGADFRYLQTMELPRTPLGTVDRCEEVLNVLRGYFGKSYGQ